jgi:hypothetical protein
MPQFVRKNLDPNGRYHLAYKTGRDENGMPTIENEIKIEGRTILKTEDKDLIKILRNDPEIAEVDKKAQIIAEREAE